MNHIRLFHKLLEDIDYACTHCMTSQAYNVESRTVINGYIALALKAKMCLYEGSYRKYHRTNPASGKEWNGNYETADDLYAAAIDACRQLIGSGVFSLHTGNPMSAYSDLFLSEDIPSEEVIWSRQANEAMNIKKEMFGKDRILSVVNGAIHDGQLSPKALIYRMTQAVHNYVGDVEQSDDLTMLAISYLKQ